MASVNLRDTMEWVKSINMDAPISKFHDPLAHFLREQYYEDRALREAKTRYMQMAQHQKMKRDFDMARALFSDSSVVVEERQFYYNGARHVEVRSPTLHEVWRD